MTHTFAKPKSVNFKYPFESNNNRTNDTNWIKSLNNNNNIQYIYTYKNSNKQQILLKQNMKIKKQRTVFYKYFRRENNYKNINIINPMTMNNSGKTSIEKLIKNNKTDNFLNIQNKKNTILK